MKTPVFLFGWLVVVDVVDVVVCKYAFLLLLML